MLNFNTLCFGACAALTIGAPPGLRAVSARVNAAFDAGGHVDGALTSLQVAEETAAFGDLAGQGQRRGLNQLILASLAIGEIVEVVATAAVDSEVVEAVEVYEGATAVAAENAADGEAVTGAAVGQVEKGFMNAALDDVQDVFDNEVVEFEEAEDFSDDANSLDTVRHVASRVGSEMNDALIIARRMESPPVWGLIVDSESQDAAGAALTRLGALRERARRLWLAIDGLQPAPGAAEEAVAREPMGADEARAELRALTPQWTALKRSLKFKANIVRPI